MTQKAPYIPILVGLGPKLWSGTLKLCQRANLSVPLSLHLLGSPDPKLLLPSWSSKPYFPANPVTVTTPTALHYCHLTYNNT